MNAAEASSPRARAALTVVEALQTRFTRALEDAAHAVGDPVLFERRAWLRDGGRHGGGHRTGAAQTPVFNRASVNVSCVHYDDEPARPLAAAVALSTIIHPQHPLAPSVHLHFSWTEQKRGAGSWRLMADLNPSIPVDDDTARFVTALRAAYGDSFDHAVLQGDKYFFIPALGRHRGVAHSYLEQFTGASFDDEVAYVERVARAAIDTYVAILRDALQGRARTAPDDEQRRTQLAYHTLYLLQVLTLDRGTTSGLLVHADNDVGTMGSLPSFVDRALLQSWRARVPPAQQPLLDALVDAIPAPDARGRSELDEAARLRLAQAVRSFYRAHPEALDLQAAGDVVPPTVRNHVGG